MADGLDSRGARTFCMLAYRIEAQGGFPGRISWEYCLGALCPFAPICVRFAFSVCTDGWDQYEELVSLGM